MLITLVLLIFATFQICHASKLFSSVDWSPYVEYSLFQDWNKSQYLVMNLPIWQYWDVENAEYEIGALPSELIKMPMYTEFVSRVSKKSVVNGEVYVRDNVPIVDMDALLMHMIAAIQELNKKCIADTVSIGVLQLEKADFAKKIVRVAEETGKEWRTAAEIRASCEVVQFRIQHLDLLLAKEQDRAKWKTENRALKTLKRRALYHAHHANMTGVKEEELRLALESSLDKASQLFELGVEALKIDHRLEATELESEHNNSAAVLNHSNTVAVEALLFRIAEETRMEREHEQLFVNVTLARMRSAEAQMTQVIETVFHELVQLTTMAVENPATVLAWAGALCSILVMLTVMHEVGIILRHMILRRWNKKYQMVAAKQATSGAGGGGGSGGTGSGSTKAHGAVALSAGVEDLTYAVKKRKQYFALCEKYRTGTAGRSEADRLEEIGVTTSACLSGAVLAPGCQEQLTRYISCLQSARYSTFENASSTSDYSFDKSVSLPNALFTGPSGVGKSLTASLISQLLGSNAVKQSSPMHIGETISSIWTSAAAAVGLSKAGVLDNYTVVTISGADLLALGPAASGMYLRELFLYIQQQGDEQGNGQAASAPGYGRKKTVRKGSRRVRKTLVIIDEADSMIASRSSRAGAVVAGETAANGFSGAVGTPSKKGSPRVSKKSSTQKGSNGDGTDAGKQGAGGHVESAATALSPLDNSCFYQILSSCRVNSPTMALLLTTTQPLSCIDDAVLDRMDHVVKFELPPPVLCARYVLQCVMELLFVFMANDPSVAARTAPGLKSDDIEALSAAQRVLLAMIAADDVLYEESYESCSAGSGIWSENVWVAYKQAIIKAAVSELKNDPIVVGETDELLGSAPRKGATGKGKISTPNSAISSLLPPGSFNACDALVLFIESITNASQGVNAGVTRSSTDHRCWSYREILKFVRNIQCDILGTESCRLTNDKWKQVLDTMLQSNAKAQHGHFL